MLAELAEVVSRPRLRQHITSDPIQLLEFIASEAIITEGSVTVSDACRDPKDDKFIACAIEASAAYIVTGDRDLLDLVAFQGIPIVRPYDLINLLGDG